jgi:multiple sugar transport system permease protein
MGIAAHRHPTHEAIMTRSMSLTTRQAITAYAFLIPAIAYFLLYFFYPIALEFWASLFRGQPLIGQSSFAGLSNYVEAVNDRRVRDSLVVTLIYAFGATGVTVVIGLGLAALLSGPIWGSTFLRAVIFFPYIISYVIVALMWKSILDPYTGILNSALIALGLPTQNWLGDVETALPTLIGITVWKDAGYAMLIYLAALQAIPSTFYEAASIDGATPTQQFRYLTLPLLMPTTLFVMVISMITHLQELAPAYLITGGGPADATQLFSFFVFRKAFFELNIGYASALSFMMFLLILAITAVQFKLGHREIRY